MKNLFDWLGKHGKGIILVVVLLAGFYLVWALNIGGMISFYSVMSWSFEKLTMEYGVNPWLARFIIIPLAALFIYLIGMMLNITDRKKRNFGTVMMVAFLSLVSLGMYFYTEDRASNNDLFDRFTGEPLKKYATINGELEIFPRHMNYHPSKGVKLELLDQTTYGNMDAKAKQENSSELAIKLRPEIPWTRTEYQVRRGSLIRIIANGYIENPKSDGKTFGPEGFFGKDYLLKNSPGSSPITIVPGYGYAGLIAKVGESGNPVYIGSKFEMKATDSGWLYLGINAVDCSNNTGELNVFISNYRFYPDVAQGLIALEDNNVLSEQVIKIKPEIPWTRTDFMVKKGGRINILANGYVRSPRSNNELFGPEGYFKKAELLSNSIWDGRSKIRDVGYSGLLAKIGENGDAFYVGSKLEMIVNASGVIYLGTNCNNCADNSGEIDVFLSRNGYYLGVTPGLRIPSDSK